MSPNDHSNWKDAAAPYLLGAMEPGEAALFEGHLTGCPECSEEVHRLEGAVRALPVMVSQVEPPAALKDRLMAEVEADATVAPSQTPEPRPSIASRLGFDRLRNLRPAPAMGFAAMLLIVGALAGYAIQGGSSDTVAPTPTAITSGTSLDAIATVTREGDSGTLKIVNLSEPPPDRVYQAWVRRGRKILPTDSLFVPNKRGIATTAIRNMDGVDEVMVTAEPPGGSAAPTSEAVVDISMET